MLTLWHARIDDLTRAEAYALSGPPYPNRPMLADELWRAGLYDLVATYGDLGDDVASLYHVRTTTRHDPSLPRGTMTGDIIQVSNGSVVTARYVVDVTGCTPLPLQAAAA